jgi:lipopolysaccharide transport system permease protein
VGYSTNVIVEQLPQAWQWLFFLNPIVCVIDGFRWCLLGGQSTIYLPGFAVSLAMVLFFLWLGVRKFRSMEKSFADII